MSSISTNSTPINSLSGNSERDVNIIELQYSASPIPNYVLINYSSAATTNYLIESSPSPVVPYEVTMFNQIADSDYIQPMPYLPVGAGVSGAVRKADAGYADDTQFFRLFIGGSGSIKVATFANPTIGTDINVSKPYVQIPYDTLVMSLKDKDVSTIKATIPATPENIDLIEERVGLSIKVELIYINKNGVVKKRQYMKFTMTTPSSDSDSDYIELRGNVKKNFSGLDRFLSYSTGTFNTDSVWVAASSGLITANPLSNAKTIHMSYLGDNTSDAGQLTVTYPFVEPSMRPMCRVTFGNSKRSMIVSAMDIKASNSGMEFVLIEGGASG